MPNLLDENGLQVQTRDEWIEYFTAKYKDIYGDDINLESNTPDGQMMNIFIQAILDTQDLLVQIYNGFDPDLAVGKVLDQRVTINGIQRRAGTYTLSPVTVITTQSVNLYGLDGSDEPTRGDGNEVYTVSDNAGNLWYLLTSQLGVTAGTHSYAFRAAVPGAQLTIPNTITVPVSIVLGVASVNNPLPYSSLGINEETDAQLKIRRQKSVSLASQGYLPGLIAALENIPGITSAYVYENTGDSVDSDGVPGHSIWVIIAGNAEDAEIAQAIYTKRNAGCGMKGTVELPVTQRDNSIFIVRWDVVQTRNLFIKFTATSINGVTSPNIESIREGLAEFTPGVNESVNVNEIATLVQDIDSNTLVTDAGLSLGYSQTFTLSGVAASGSFKIVYNEKISAAINWDDTTETIEDKIQAIEGLAAATVSGSIAGQSLEFDLSSVGSVEALLYTVENSLATSDPVAITFSYDADYANKLNAPTKQNQLVVTSANIQILDIVLTPTSNTVAAEGTIQFKAVGGYGAHTFSLSVNNSGGSINAGTGLYTAGSTPSVSDTVKVEDALGNSKTVEVSVTP